MTADVLAAIAGEKLSMVHSLGLRLPRKSAAGPRPSRRRSIGPPRQWTRPPMTNGVRTQGTREEAIEGGHTNFPVP